MIKKYLRKIMRWALSSDSDAPQPDEVTPYHGNKTRSGISAGSSEFGKEINGMNFIVYGAIGGKVVQFSTYDPVRDRGFSNLYIVTDKEDLGEEIGQIITKESLSR